MEWIKHFDHPLLFLLFLFMALKGFEAAVTWGAKAAGLNGLATLAQHP